MIFEWEKLPVWLEQEKERVQDRLCTELSHEDTIRNRARYRLLQDILALPNQEPPEPVDEMSRLVRQIEEKEGYAD